MCKMTYKQLTSDTEVSMENMRVWCMRVSDQDKAVLFIVFFVALTLVGVLRAVDLLVSLKPTVCCCHYYSSYNQFI